MKKYVTVRLSGDLILQGSSSSVWSRCCTLLSGRIGSCHGGRRERNGFLWETKDFGHSLNREPVIRNVRRSGELITVIADAPDGVAALQLTELRHNAIKRLRAELVIL